MKKILLLFIIAVFCVPFSHGQQDIHFSQFWTAPMLINPATAGAYHGSFRGVTHYRSQWSTVTTPFVTMHTAADVALARDILDNDYFSGGISFFNDKAGESQFTNNKVDVSLAYGKMIDPQERHYVALGLQVGIGQRSIYMSKVTWDKQFDGDGFDRGLPAGEDVTDESMVFFDVGGGAYYFGDIDDNTKVFGGVGAFHLNAPEISFIGIEERMIRKMIFHAGADLKISGTDLFFTPNAIYMMQGPNRMLNLGGELKFRIKEATHYTGLLDEASFGFGTYYRYRDAMVVVISASWAGFGLGISYDLNVSRLSVASRGMGGPEFMLRYRAGYKKGSKSKNSSSRFL